MGDWRMQSVAQRRRIGAPHSIHGGAEPVATEDSMATALSGMAAIGNPRVPMDRSALTDMVNASAEYTSATIMQARHSQPYTDPAFFPTNARQPVLEQGTSGARYRIQVPVGGLGQPELGPTQSSGRVIRNRGGAGGSFWGG